MANSEITHTQQHDTHAEETGTPLRIFDGFEIRSLWSEEEEDWYFSVVDVVAALTGSKNPRRYWSDLKKKLETEGSQLYEKIVQLKMLAPDGKMRKTDAANTEQTPKQSPCRGLIG